MQLRKRWLIAFIFGIVSIGLLRIANAETVAEKRKKPLKSPFENKLYRQLKERDAVRDGYRKLMEAVKGLRLDSTTEVRDFVKENDRIEAALDNFLKRKSKITDKRYNINGICEIDIGIEVKLIIIELKRLYKQHLHSNKWLYPDTFFDNIPTYYNKEFIKVTGVGMPMAMAPGL